ncbi:Hypothetical protein ZAZAV_243, partial [Cedratvirus Zaza IHUMI]
LLKRTIGTKLDRGCELVHNLLKRTIGTKLIKLFLLCRENRLYKVNQRSELALTRGYKLVYTLFKRTVGTKLLLLCGVWNFQTLQRTLSVKLTKSTLTSMVAN